MNGVHIYIHKNDLVHQTIQELFAELALLKNIFCLPIQNTLGPFLVRYVGKISTILGQIPYFC